MDAPSEERPARVVAYAGGRGEEEPRALLEGGARREVRAVVARWREPRGRGFRVRLADGAVATLLCREADGAWVRLA